MRIKKVKYICDYKLKILFSDNKTKIVDFEDKLKKAKGIFLPLKKQEYFSQVALDDCQLSICWPNGADICPDLLYEMGEEVQDPKHLITKHKNQTPLRSSRAAAPISSKKRRG